LKRKQLTRRSKKEATEPRIKGGLRLRCPPRQLSPGFAQKAKLFGVPKIHGIFEHASEAKQRLAPKNKCNKKDKNKERAKYTKCKSKTKQITLTK